MDEKKFEEIKDNISKGTKKAKEQSMKISKDVKEKIEFTQKELTKKLDVNGDGVLDIEDVILMAMEVPGIKINRAEFLKKEFIKELKEDEIDEIIKTNPATAGVDSKIINKHVDEVIKYERNCVSGISAALGMPGGISMIATIPADIIQYYGYMLRAAQKMLYLYGFPEINIKNKSVKLDTETLNELTICLGVMYGVAGASNAIKAMAKALGNGVQKQLMKKALTKGTIYPIVRNVAKWFSVTLTKEMYTGFFKKAIPVIGGVIGGGITFVSFKPCCDKLKKTLENTVLSNPKYVSTKEEEKIYEEIIEAKSSEENDEKE